MSDTRTFKVKRFIDEAYQFFGVEQYTAVGAFAGHSLDEVMTVDAAVALVSAYLARPVPGPPGPPGPSPSLGNFLPPVETTDALPMVGNGRGDVRIVLADMLLYGWNENTHAWQVIAGGGGGGGGGGGAVQNLFVQQVAPDTGGLLLDSLWIATNPDGTNKNPAFWQIFTGNGNGNGGNLFVQQAAPNPLVDALWVPLNSDGTPKYIDEWQTFTGRGNPTGVGNPNLFIGPTLPVGAPLGTLFIPTNPDETAKTPDLWRINT